MYKQEIDVAEYLFIMKPPFFETRNVNTFNLCLNSHQNILIVVEKINNHLNKSNIIYQFKPELANWFCSFYSYDFEKATIFNLRIWQQFGYILIEPIYISGDYMTYKNFHDSLIEHLVDPNNNDE